MFGKKKKTEEEGEEETDIDANLYNVTSDSTVPSSDIFTWINRTDDNPAYLRAIAWSVLSRKVGLGKMSKRDYMVFIHDLDAIALMLKISTPPEIGHNPKFIMDLMNMQVYGRVNAQRALTGDITLNERQLMAATGGITYTTRQKQERKKVLGLF